MLNALSCKIDYTKDLLYIENPNNIPNPQEATLDSGLMDLLVTPPSFNPDDAFMSPIPMETTSHPEIQIDNISDSPIDPQKVFDEFQNLESQPDAGFPTNSETDQLTIPEFPEITNIDSPITQDSDQSEPLIQELFNGNYSQFSKLTKSKTFESNAKILESNSSILKSSDKVLLEKILYSCSDLKKVYILLRGKRGLTIQERLKTLLELPVFSRVYREKAKFCDKIEPIVGDVSQDGLGISPEDRVTFINEASYVFHSAASIKFIDPLHDLLNVNVKGTERVLSLCKCMKKLERIAHKIFIEEKVYPSPMPLSMIDHLIKEQPDEERTKIIINELPFPGAYFTNSKLLLVFLSAILQTSPLSLADALLRMTGKDPKYRKMLRRIEQVRDILEIFTSNSWKFSTMNKYCLYSSLSPSDQKTFPFSPSLINWSEYIPIYVDGFLKSKISA
ncbi:unnamed protein product [Pieris brassicae]|uniref:Fatty acyl-CoA reductase n=1 Tax=Pieris brassicae TaxID=7116 RepID=A0A9P0WW79_PIEBR|nr:unnamed protein product [Pieris brassicae]